MKILYIVNRFGTPPLNFFMKYLIDETTDDLYVLKIPSTSPSNGPCEYGAFILNTRTNEKKEFKLSLPIKFPEFVQHFIQYTLNLYSLFKLIYTIKVNKFEIGIGESSFGAFALFLLKKLAKINYSIFMNGDIIPTISKDKKTFYLSGDTSSAIKYIDNLFIWIQSKLRRLGFQNNLIWYPNKNIREWDLNNGFSPKDYIISQTVLVDKNEVSENIKAKRQKDTLSYIGRLDENAGIDISLKALVEVKREIPNIKLLLVGGGGSAVDKYKKMANDLGISNNTTFFGFVDNNEQAFNLLKVGSLGLSLYKPDENNVSMYAEPSKPKEYIRLGMPSIMSKGGPSIGNEMEKEGVAILAEYDALKIAKAIIKYIHENQYTTYVKSINKFAIKYDYYNVNKKFISEIKNRYNRAVQQ